MPPPETSPLDPKFVALLCCPYCTPRHPLALSTDQESFLCSTCQRTYPRTNGFPDLRPDDMKAPAPAAQGAP